MQDDEEHVEVVVSLNHSYLEKTKTLKELRQMCVDNDISAHGKKSELAARLFEFREANGEK